MVNGVHIFSEWADVKLMIVLICFVRLLDKSLAQRLYQSVCITSQLRDV